MGRIFFLIILLLLGGAESFRKHLQTRRKTNHSLSEADGTELLKLFVGGAGLPVVIFGSYFLGFINTANEKKFDKLEKSISDAQAGTEKKIDKLEKSISDAQAGTEKKIDKLEKYFLEAQAATRRETREHRKSIEKSLSEAQAATTRDLREHQLATATALEKMITAIQTAELHRVAAQVRNEKDTDKI